jgi:hypothetical protein
MPNDTVPASAPSLPAVWTAKDQFELEQRQARLFSRSTLVPAQYQGEDNLGNCLIALNMAQRIGADPLMVMQNLYLVQGKPGWSGQFLIATFNQCGRFSAMRFEWHGKQGEKDWGCRAYAIEKATGETIRGAWVTWKMVEAEGWSKKSGSKWLTMPEQMFHYRAAAFLVRAYAPEIAMGLQTVEEIGDVIDVTPMAETKIEAVKNALKERLGDPEKPNGNVGGLVDPPSYAMLRDALEKATADSLPAVRKQVDEHGGQFVSELRDLADARAVELGVRTAA